MAHFRGRYASVLIHRLQALWPIVGVVGPRQVGKTSLLEHHFTFGSEVSFDEASHVRDAKNDPTGFINRLETPVLLDEIQKVPELFDALKLRVHKRKGPGQFFLTGSVSFSEGAHIRESLTGRIGMVELFPLTLGEANQLPAPGLPTLNPAGVGKKPRLSLDSFSEYLSRGGMPFPMFLRDHLQRSLYWQGWLSTTILKDLSTQVKREFNPDFAFELIQRVVKLHEDGQYPTISKIHEGNPRKAKRYLEAMEAIFLLRRRRCHSSGTGLDAWFFNDVGLLNHLLQGAGGEGATLALYRHALWNELSALISLHSGRSMLPYFKSGRGTEVDFVLDGTPVRIVPLNSTGRGPWGWYDKALKGAQKALKVKNRVMLAPIQKAEIHTDSDQTKLWILPFTVWS